MAEVVAQPRDEGRRPTVLVLARRLGMTNPTFWRHFPQMGHAGGRRGAADGSVIGVRYRHTTPEMEARAVAAIDQRLAVALAIAGFEVPVHSPSC
jgi:hypothetical protein